jgi:tRNA(fMet)-specific endonuclease VapC
VTVFELFCGVRRAQSPDGERQKVEHFLAAVPQLPFDILAARIASEIRMELAAKGTPIGPYDLLIAGEALASGLILVTGNEAEFSRVQGLRLESWA